MRRKIATVLSREAIGLEGLSGAAQADFRCYVPLTERTVDATYYYPCSVYLREGGAPLGMLAEPQDMQRAKSAAFVRQGACGSDPICRRYCLHCTKNYNLAANAARLDAEDLEHAKRQAVEVPAHAG